ncbi:histone deacetylase [Halobacteriovorax sp. GB3]|uniref:histone deacetylase family protein n=1 Tax=Halobacteriovorax sp. GB3 TaxID=2719615 RepID=UPI0023609028|nr:histone deacetylase [Halobacteriovorax sp. GB3]MDD0852008.1 histone deacetylase [Halobacteriovorax sp. GB3]
MIIYNEQMDQRFSDFGIMIPIVDDRSQKVASNLKIEQTPLDKIPLISRDDLLLVHSKDYVDSLFDELRREQSIFRTYELINLDGSYHRYEPQNALYSLDKLVDRILLQAGASLLAMKRAIAGDDSFVLAGGMHHAMKDSGRGFCLINDIVIGIRKLQNSGEIKTAWVIDVDAHKGDGTAEVCFGDDSIRTMSIHMKRGWPLCEGEGSEPWFLPSDLDIEVDVGQESDYLFFLSKALEKMEKGFGLPDLCVVVCGADPYEKDELESANLLKLTKEQMLKRDLLVFDFFKMRKIPQAYVMAGGYGKSSYEIYEQFIKESFL